MVLGLAFPIDIPWTRLCVSEDMMAPMDVSIRPRWRSSLAVFGYEPPEEAQTVPDMTVSYLKVTATLTGFQPDGDEVGLRDRRAYHAWFDSTIIEHYEQAVGAYYPCYGAILEVTVAPKASREELAKIPLSGYPYFADFEPKKRELYELVSDTGETMSRSLETVNVRKGATTTEGHEVLDVFGGAKAAGKAKGVEAELGFSGQWGTQDMSQQQIENVRTSEAGREQRETFSHSTQLTQLYHQLNSYHLGTNRAVFYVLPRPHMVETERTFVNGPRVLEGVQEFFLVVMRPRDMKGLCVQAHLETAHLAATPELHFPTTLDSFTFTMHLPAPSPSQASGVGEDDRAVDTKRETFTYHPPQGFEIDVEQGSSAEGCDFTLSGKGYRTPIVQSTANSMVVTGEVEASLINRWPRNDIATPGHLDMAVTVYLKATTPTVTGYDHTLYLTARSVGTCPPPGGQNRSTLGESVVFEQPITLPSKAPIGGTAAMSIAEANRIRAEVGRRLAGSSASPNRYPLGAVRFTETDFVAHLASGLMSRAAHPDNVAPAAVRGFDPALAQRIARVAPNATRRRLLAMSQGELADRLGLTTAEVVRLRRALLGLDGPAPSGPTRWQRPGARAR